MANLSDTFYIYIYTYTQTTHCAGRKEENVLFCDTLNTFVWH